MSGDNLTILVAVAAGVISFLSPCVLPLVPAYLGQLTAVAVACLTLFDMLKAIDRSLVIGGIAVVSKTGGKSGEWDRG